MKKKTIVNGAAVIVIGGLILGLLGYVGLEVRDIRTHVFGEVPTIKKWIDYGDQPSGGESSAVRIATLETWRSETDRGLKEAQDLLAQLLGPVAGEATRQRSNSSTAAVYINLAGDARKFIHEPKLVITNERGIPVTLPVNTTFRFPKDYEDAEILLTVPASEQLMWDDNVKGKKRMPVTIKRVAN